MIPELRNNNVVIRHVGGIVISKMYHGLLLQFSINVSAFHNFVLN